MIGVCLLLDLFPVQCFSLNRTTHAQCGTHGCQDCRCKVPQEFYQPGLVFLRHNFFLMKNEEVAGGAPVRCHRLSGGAPVRCHRLSGGAPVRCRVLPRVRPHHRMAFMSNGLRMGGLTRGKTLQLTGAPQPINNQQSIINKTLNIMEKNEEKKKKALDEDMLNKVNGGKPLVVFL